MFHLSKCLLLFCCCGAIINFAAAADELFGRGPLEPLLKDSKFPTGLTESEVASLPIGDPNLRVAYYFLVKYSQQGAELVDERTPEMVSVLNDLRRRGSTATPLLIDLMEKNQNTHLEYMIPYIITRIDTIEKEPYVEYLRRVIRTRPNEINATAFETAVMMFLQFGNAEDVKLCKELEAKRPFLSYALQHALDSHALSLPKLEQNRNSNSDQSEQEQISMNSRPGLEPGAAPAAGHSAVSPAASQSTNIKSRWLIGFVIACFIAVMCCVIRMRR